MDLHPACLEEQAKALIDEGCFIKAHPSRVGIFYLCSPGDKEGMTVFTTPLPEFCPCSNFQKLGCCEHLLAVHLEQEREAAQMAAFEEQKSLLAEGECFLGCDWPEAGLNPIGTAW